MRTWIKLAALPAGLAAAAFAFLASRSDAAASIDDTTGLYGGKITFKFAPLAPLMDPSHGSETSTMQVTQTGANLAINLTIDTVEGPKVYTLNGNYGQNLFYAIGNSPEGHMVLTGKASGKAPKLVLKGDAKLVSSGGITTIKFNHRSAPPQ